MANGLRKLIRKTRRISNSNLTRRINRFGPRLRVEELEERIAPAAVTLDPGEFAVWDVAGGTDAVHDATDGILGLSTTSTVDSVAIDLTEAGGGDTAVLDITVTDTDGAGAETIVIVSNQAIGAVNISGLNTGTTTLTLVVASGVNFTDADAGAGDDLEAIVASTTYTFGTKDAGSTTAHGDTDVYTGLANSGIGNTDVGATNFTTMAVTATYVVNGTGSIGNLDFSDSTDNADTSLAGTITSGGTIGNIAVGGALGNGTTGAVISAAGNIGTITVGDSSDFGHASTTNSITATGGDIGVVSIAGASVGTLTTVTSGNIGNITAAGSISGNITSAGTIGDITSTDGSLSGNVSAAGTISNIDADSNGTGAISGTITTTNSGNIGTIDTGGNISGAITSAGTIGNITSTNGSISIAITAAGNIGNVSADANDSNDGLLTSAASITSGGTLGTVTAGENIAGDITAASTIGGIISLNGDITSDVAISAGGTIGSIQADADASDAAGLYAATLTQTAGGITTLAFGGNITTAIESTGNIGTIGAADVTAAIDADGTIGAITLTGELSAEITAGGNFNLGVSAIASGITGTDSGLRSEGGNVTGALTITNNGMAANTHINADDQITADITATNGDLAGDILANNDITGAIDATAGSITGRISTGQGDILGDISAGTAITGPINTSVGDLLGSIEAGNGDITNVTIGGEISADNGNLTIQATGGAVTLSATGGIDTDGHDIDILGDTGVTITSSTMSADGGDTLTIGGDDDGGDDGDVTITTSGSWLAAGTTNIDGANITVTSGGSMVVDDITATVNVTSIAVTGSLTANDITAATDITNVTATGSLTANDIEATAGDVVNMTSGSTMILNDVDTGDDITNIASSGSLTLNDATAANDVTNISSAGSMNVDEVVATAGDVVNVDAGGSLTIGTLIRATAGDVLNVEGTGITGDITATAGKVVNVDAGSGGYNGVINSNVATSASALLTVTSSNVIYTIETDAGAAQAEFDITYTDDGAGGADPYADLDVDIQSGSGWDLSLKSNTASDISSAEIDLNSLTIAAASTSRDLGVVTVDGDVLGTLNLEGALPNNSTMEALIVQDNLLTNSGTQRVLVGSLSLITATNIGGADATAALADLVTEKFGGGAPTSTDLSATYIIPISQTQGDIVEVFAPGAGTFAPTASLIGFIAGSQAGEVSMQLIASALGAIDGQGSGAGVRLPGGVPAGGMDLSTFGGPIIVNGNVDGVLTLANNEGVTINGNINADVDGSAGSVTMGGFTATGDGDVTNATITFITINGNLTLGDLVNSHIVTNGVAGNVSMGNVDADSTVTITDGNVLTGPDITGNFTAQSVAGPLTLGGVGGNIYTWTLGAPLNVDTSVGGSLTIDGSANATITVGGSVGGSVIVWGSVNAAMSTGGIGANLQTGVINDTVTVGTVGGNVSTSTVNAALTTNNVTGNVSTGHINAVTNIGNIGGNLTTALINAEVTTGNVGGNVTTNGWNINGDVTIGNIGGSLFTGAIGNTTDVLVDVGNVNGGPTTIGSIGSDSTLDIGLITGGLTVTGAMNGSLLIDEGAGDNSGNSVTLGSMGSVILITGSVADVTSNGNLGIAGSVIAATEHIDTIESLNGNILANIFTSGDGASDMEIIAENGVVSGAFAVGQRDGITGLEVTSAPGGEEDTDSVVALEDDLATPAPFAASANAGNFDGTNPDEFTLIILGADVFSLTVSNDDGPNGANIGDILIANDFAGSIQIAEDITGTITVDDDTDVSVILNVETTFDTLAATLVDPNEITNADNFADVLDDLPTSALQLIFGDDGGPVDLDGDAEIGANSIGGLVVAGNIGSPLNTVDIDVVTSMGHIIALNGSVNANVHAGTAIGSIVASEDITGDYISEGTLGLDGFLGTSLSGVPDWFTGGILAEVGNIDDANFAASNITGMGLVPEYGDAMGIIFVPVGDITDTDINVAGNFGGIHALAGTITASLNVPAGASIARMITPAGANITGNYPDADIDASGGAGIVVEGSAYENGDLMVTVTGGGTLAIVNGDNIMLIGGLAVGASIDIEGDVDELGFGGDWAGAVGSDSVVETLDVDGGVEATATLDVDNFTELLADSVASPLTDSGTLDKNDPSDAVQVNGVTVSTIYLAGSRNVDADWEAVFGKVMTVDIAGRGKADLVLVEGTATDDQLKAIAKAGEVDDGSANLGEVVADAAVKLDDVVVQGSVDELVANRINDLWISGSAGTVMANRLNAAFIGEDIDTLIAQTARNVTVDGDAGSINANKLQRVMVLGHTDHLNITGSVAGNVRGVIANSIFRSVGAINFDMNDRYSQVRIRNSVIPMGAYI